MSRWVHTNCCTRLCCATSTREKAEFGVSGVIGVSGEKRSLLRLPADRDHVLLAYGPLISNRWAYCERNHWTTTKSKTTATTMREASKRKSEMMEMWVWVSVMMGIIDCCCCGCYNKWFVCQCCASVVWVMVVRVGWKSKFVLKDGKIYFLNSGVYSGWCVVTFWVMCDVSGWFLGIRN